MMIISKPMLSLSLFMALTAIAVNAQGIHVHAAGSAHYVGAAGLKRALLDVSELGTIYVHSGGYDLGATPDSFLVISKGLTLIGLDDGAGRPVIKGARTSGSPGLLLVNAPGKAVTLDHLEFSFLGVRGVNIDAAVLDQASGSFTVRDCAIAGAYFDGEVNQGLYAAVVIRGIARSEFSGNPTFVKGEVKILNSTLTGRVSGLAIGFSGPVSLDKIEVSNCVFNVLGLTRYGDGNRGNFGLMILQYPFYMTDANRSSLLEATHAGTQTIIRNNIITASNPVYLFYLKGVQRVEKNRLHSVGAWFDSTGGGKYYQQGIMAAGYPRDQSDPATYSEAVISDNVIDLQVPPFPLAGFPQPGGRPEQTTSNTFPPTGIRLGVGQGFIFSSSSLAGHHAKVTVTGNVISSSAFPIPYLPNDPDYGIYLTGEVKDSLVLGNHLAGGMLKDPIDDQVRLFNAFTAKVSQLHF